MRPSLEDFLKSSARWRGEHNGITYELSWHGMSNYNPQGTWCWYIFVSSQQFYPDDWAKLRLGCEDKQLLGTSWHRHWDYDSFPDLEAHGGWTWGEMSTHLDKDGTEYEQVKVGCDYAHSWDRDMGYPENRTTVEHDVKRSIDLLCKMFPRRRLRCDWSGQYDDAEQFYTARNGRRVHKSQEENLRDDTWGGWLPAEAMSNQDGKDHS